MTQNRQPEGIPTGGQYAATTHAEGTLTLAGRAAPRPELAGYDIPAPLEGQKYLDGTPITGTTFEEAYEEFFRPLEEYEAEHGTWETTRPPSESTLLKLAGIDQEGLGKVRGVFLDSDDTTGEPLIEVHTDNPRYCLRDGCDGTCHACLEDDIHALPNFVRATSEEGDVSHFFRPANPEAAQRYLADKKTREMLNHRLYARQAITSGKVPPWAILTPVRTGDERAHLTGSLSRARREANVWTAALDYTDKVTAALDAGGPLPTKPVSENYPEGGILYDMHREAVTNLTAEAATAKAQAAELQAELRQGLPPAAAALVTAEQTRLKTAADTATKKAAKARASIANDVATMRAWASRRYANGDPKVAAVASLEASLRAFDWSSSWPGDPADCPPKVPQE